MMKRMRLLQFFVAAMAAIVFFALSPAGGLLDAHAAEETVKLVFFWGDGCPHCAEQKPFLEYLKRTYPTLDIEAYETWYNKGNARLYVDLAKAFGIKPSGVPATFLGDRVWIGFSERVAREIEGEVLACLDGGCIDPLERLRGASQAGRVARDEGTISPLKPVCVHVFLKEGCPQCEGVVPYLDALKNQYNIDLIKHDVTQADQKALYDHFKDTYGFDSGGYPALFMGDRYLLGDAAIRKNFEKQIKECSFKGCVCPAERIRGIAPYPPRPKDITPEAGSSVDIPLLGSIDAAEMSLPLITVILGGLDSFNPCAFFVLFVLLGMLVHARSRVRMLLIGGTFVFFSGLIYFLFMAAWLNLFMMVGHLTAITVVAGIVALIVAFLNIKDFFFFGKGASLVIPDKAKPKLFQRMRALLKATSIPSMMIGTIVLAIGANAYELLCTAGFPMVFTRILTLHDLSGFGYYLYLALYNVVYVIPLFIIVLIFVITLGGRKLSEAQGQILKLLSGLMMLCLGVILIMDPALLNNMYVAGGVLLGVAALTSFIVLFRGLLRKYRRIASEDDEG
jgi:thiol-disulfide isomerase/thioredoxin